jgi:RND family efflux transporter MFP subunit
MKYKSFIIAAVAVSLAACNNQPQTTPADVEIPVSIIEVRQSSIDQLINTTGTVLPTAGVELVSEMAGIYKLQTNPRTGRPFKLGDMVSKDQIIIRLEDREFEVGIAVEARRLSLEIAEQEERKQRELYELGGVTLTEMRNTEVRVTNARYDLESANIRLGRMAIKAPFNGVIVSLPHYTADARVDQGRPMVGIMNFTSMYMDVNFPESTIEYIRANQPANITHYTLPNDTLKGVVSELSPAISTETRTFRGKILIDNSELKLRPGMFVRADVIVDRAEEAIIIPKNVILSDRNRRYVFIVERGVAIRRNIRIGIENENNAQVINGLAENDNLIVRGFETLRENSRVRILQ